VRVGREDRGRDALKRWFEVALSGHAASVHFVGEHVVSFDDADHARGVVYCRDELERSAGSEWHVGMLQYWDTYLRVDGEWCFERRRFHRWYIGDALTRPAVGLGVSERSDGLTTNLLPEGFAALGPFWRAQVARD
jgi:SnoaL-like domain